MFYVQAVTKKPYKSFAEFIGSKGKRCRRCHGLKWEPAPGEQSDPIEGHKLSRKIDCPECRGSGSVESAKLREYYDKDIADWKIRYAHERKQRAIQLSALRKLNKKEKEALGLTNPVLEYK